MLASAAWTKAKVYIEELHSSDLEKNTAKSDPGDSLNYEYDMLSEFRKTAWYNCIFGERGFKDIPDWNNIIEPKVDALKNKIQDLPEDEQNKIIQNNTRGWIEEIRLKKDTENVNVVEAIFPQLPFKSESFDRIVASWSLSAHVFAKLTEEEFEVFWDESYRVLKDKGEMYIFPLTFHYYVDDTLLNSLDNMREKYLGSGYYFIDNAGNRIDEEGNGEGYEYTLVTYKNK